MICACKSLQVDMLWAGSRFLESTDRWSTSLSSSVESSLCSKTWRTRLNTYFHVRFSVGLIFKSILWQYISFVPSWIVSVPSRKCMLPPLPAALFAICIICISAYFLCTEIWLLCVRETNFDYNSYMRSSRHTQRLTQISPQNSLLPVCSQETTHFTWLLTVWGSQT